VCSRAGLVKLKAPLEEREAGEPEQKRRDRINHCSNCSFAFWYEETDSHITQKGSLLSVLTAHNHDLLESFAAKAAWGPTRDGIPPDIILEARRMQQSMNPAPSVATIAKFLTERESAAAGQQLNWSVKQFQNELAPDAASVALDSAKFLQMLHAIADQMGERVAPPALCRAATPPRDLCAQLTMVRSSMCTLCCTNRAAMPARDARAPLTVNSRRAQGLVSPRPGVRTAPLRTHHLARRLMRLRQR
jgi:hypothetical protein